MKPNILLSRTCAAWAAGILATATLADAQTLPAAPETTDREVIELETLDVTAAREADSYAAAIATSSSRFSVPLLETAQNIQVVPRALIDDQGAFQLQDILQNVAGVMPGGYYDNWDYFRIRGFNADFNTFLDGLRGGNGLGEETFGLERVEVVKGPSSALFGKGPLSGLVNLVSKRPHERRAGTLQFTAGSYGFYEFGLDYNTPLDGAGRVLGRFVGVWRDRDSFVDFAGTERVFLAPSLTWRITDDTSVTLLGTHSDADVRHAMPLPAAGTVLPNPNGRIPHSRYVGEPGSSLANERATNGGWEFVHRFTPALVLRQNLRYDYFNQEWFDMLYPSHLDADQRTLFRYPYDYFQSWHDLAADTRLEAVVRTGEITHQLVGGFDYYRKTYHANWATIDFSDPTGAGFIPLDLYNPVYGTPVPDMPSVGASDESTRNVGFYVHDHVRFPGGVTLTAGGRYDVATTNGVEHRKFTPRAGATWQFRAGVTLYGTYSESFNTQSGMTLGGNPVDPETGENVEIGLKTAAADGRLTATLSLYQLTRQNVATADLTNPGFVLLSGEQRSRGFEFDGRFQPVIGAELSAAYAYTDAEITADNTLPVGARRPGVPRHSVSGWAKYTVQEGAWRGFGFGLGGRYYTKQTADETFAEPFELPAYGLVDAALYYNAGRYRVQLNVDNLFDREYYEGAYNRVYVLPGKPITIRGTVAWKF